MPIGQFVPNLKPFFEKESRNLVGQYKRLIKIKRGIGQDDAPANAPATVDRKGFSHWMIQTGETNREGYGRKVRPTGFTVFALRKQHSGKTFWMTRSGVHYGVKKNPPTYEQLFSWHNTADGRYSGVFQKLPSGSKFPERLEKEFDRQMIKHLKRTVPKIIRG